MLQTLWKPICSTSLTLLTVLSPLPVLAEEITRTLTITGVGTMSVPTTITRVRVAVEIRGKQATEVQRQVAQRTAALIELLRSQGVERLQTTGIRLRPYYDTQENNRQLLGYTGSNSIAFRIATDEAGKLIDASIERGATRIDGIEFLATEEELIEARKVALRRAAINAQEQANIVLEALNLSSQEIVSVQIHNNTGSFPIQSNALLRGGDTEIVGSDQTVQASVTLTIRY